jgi:hypothetical protein
VEALAGCSLRALGEHLVPRRVAGGAKRHRPPFATHPSGAEGEGSVPCEETDRCLRMVGGIARPLSPTSTGRLAYQEGKKRPMAAPQAYCVKCKTKREMLDATQIQMKNGRPATEGKCPVCGTKMFKIGAA